MDEKLLMEKRLGEMARRAYMRGVPVFSDFVSPEVAAAFLATRPEPKPQIWGGYAGAERCMLGFGLAEYSQIASHAFSQDSGCNEPWEFPQGNLRDVSGGAIPGEDISGGTIPGEDVSRGAIPGEDLSGKASPGEKFSKRTPCKENPPGESRFKEVFPLACISITAKNRQFGGDFGHRDVLGSLLATGLERAVLGDILLSPGRAYVFCHRRVEGHICSALERVGRAPVEVAAGWPPADMTSKAPVERQIQLASPRVDAVLAKVWNISRGQAAQLLAAQRVFVDGRICANGAKALGEGAALTLRGYGKCRLGRLAGHSRKGREIWQVEVY